MIWKKIALLFSALVTGCAGLPAGITPVTGFQLDRYLGTWYEVARLDHSFERGLIRVSADYSMREDGGVRVVNRGFLAAENRWKEAVGRAYFVKGPGEGYLKVSFFGPFFGSYIVLELDRENYQYSLVSGPDRSYLWILSRTRQLRPEVQDMLVAKAASLGFPTDKLIFVAQPAPTAAEKQ
jgi:apolipoprotein D and lipocalin family protein